MDFLVFVVFVFLLLDGDVFPVLFAPDVENVFPFAGRDVAFEGADELVIGVDQFARAFPTTVDPIAEKLGSRVCVGVGALTVT